MPYLTNIVYYLIFQLIGDKIRRFVIGNFVEMCRELDIRLRNTRTAKA